TLNWLRKTASETNIAICGSLIISENDAFYNRFVFMPHDGQHQIYDKRHTFTLSRENEVYQSGRKKVTFDFKGWKICPQVCYDLRFPVWSRNVEDYDLLIYVANWPKERIYAWDALLKARAIENMSYCIGVNRIGSDGNGYKFSGHSAAYDGLGNRIAEFKESENAVKSVTLQHAHLEDIRQRLKFLDDRDNFTLEV
ncbi:MAG: nitrilase family protein, partial [Bacteroidia bacterium]|nr:nitrilase family protein [Bacteroidia bacterium]